MAFEKVHIDPTRRATLTADGHKWRRHNIQQYGAAINANVGISRLESEAQRLGNSAPNGLWDKALILKAQGESALAGTIESDEALVRNVDTMLGRAGGEEKKKKRKKE